ncbi:MAG: NAD(P)/FAD-dependent oxidoreductase [Dehalococcoidia bacterium]
MYDAIVIGARCAGSPTAMLLARAGYKVLLLDKATFPSDKLSTHYIQPPGVNALEEWGLLDRVVSTGAPPITEFRVHVGGVRLPMPPQDGIAFCPRRYLLDAILVDAAKDAGAEVRTAFKVDEVLMDGDRVTGIRGHGRDEMPVEESARYVVGAEGHHSLVADTVRAPKYREREALTGGYYSYFSGLPMDAAEVHVSDRGGVLAFPTNNNQVCIAAGTGKANFPEYRKDIESGFFNIVDGSPEFAKRVRAARREERWMGTADVPNFFRRPWGPGWALVGDAGYMKDPVTGFGITDAFRDAGLLSSALDQVFAGTATPEEALGGYQSKRDEAAGPVYEMTLAMASGEMANMLGG